MSVDGDDRKYNRGWVTTATTRTQNAKRKTHFLASLAALIEACSSSVFSPAAEAGGDEASADMGRAVPGAAGRRRRVDRDDGGDAARLGDDDDDDDEKAETRNDGRPRTTTAARRMAAVDRRRSMRRRGAMKFFGCRAAASSSRPSSAGGGRTTVVEGLWGVGGGSERGEATHCMHAIDGQCSKKKAGRVTHETRSVHSAYLLIVLMRSNVQTRSLKIERTPPARTGTAISGTCDYSN